MHSSTFQKTFNPLDATHTASEQKIYSIIYRQTISQGTKEAFFTNKQLRELTGINSHVTARTAVSGLMAKGSIERAGGKDCSHDGIKFRVYTPPEIMVRRRQQQIEIDLKGKKIASSTTRSPISSTGSATKSVAEKKASTTKSVAESIIKDAFLQGETRGPISPDPKRNHDDDHTSSQKSVKDQMAAPDELRATIRFYTPGATEQQIDRAIGEMHALLAQQMQQWNENAKTPPSSPQFFVECLRRSLLSTKEAIQPAQQHPPSKQGSTSNHTRANREPRAPRIVDTNQPGQTDEQLEKQKQLEFEYAQRIEQLCEQEYAKLTQAQKEALSTEKINELLNSQFADKHKRLPKELLKKHAIDQVKKDLANRAIQTERQNNVYSDSRADNNRPPQSARLGEKDTGHPIINFMFTERREHKVELSDAPDNT